MNDEKRFRHIVNGLQHARDIVDQFLAQQDSVKAIARVAARMAACYRAGGRVLSCGNGGSLCDAMHFAEELTGRFRRDRAALSAIPLGDPSHMTCVGNDFGFDKVFSRGVEAHGRPGDVLLAISTSGTSPNVLEAVRAARARGIFSVSLTGRPRSVLSELVDIDICAVGDESSSQPTERTQELHIKIIHLMIELIEMELFPENYPN